MGEWQDIFDPAPSKLGGVTSFETRIPKIARIVNVIEASLIMRLRKILLSGRLL